MHPADPAFTFTPTPHTHTHTNTHTGVNIARTRSFPEADIGSDHDLLMLTLGHRATRQFIGNLTYMYFLPKGSLWVFRRLRDSIPRRPRGGILGRSQTSGQCPSPKPLGHPFIRSGQNHLARHSDRAKKTKQTEGKVWRQHQGMDRPGVRQVPEGSREQGKMEETGCEIVCGAPTTLAVKR